MKKKILASMLPLFMLSACDFGSSQKSRNEELTHERDSLNQVLEQTMADQNALMTLMGEITDDITKIKSMENILSNPAAFGEETPSKKEQLKADIEAIQLTLQKRREQLDQLEKKLKASGIENAAQRETISKLKKQIEEQEGTITALNRQLEEANIAIKDLNNQVSNLNTTVEEVSEAKRVVEEKNLQLNNELNTCYYAIGSKKELKDNNIIETGFLKKTTVLPEDFQMKFFQKGDKRTLKTIDLHSKKAKILTGQPSDSYVISDKNGSKILEILNPFKFWEKSNYLVIEIN